jgi:hydrogenase nickel incorporation protein HypB
MCATCGCGESEAEGHSHEHGHEHAHDPRHVSVEQALLAENDRLAAYNKGYFDGRRIRCLNLISSPGSGKTTLLEKTLAALLAKGAACTVIEGDQATDLDAQRIARTGAKVTQIETGRACHLDAHQVQHALEKLAPPPDSLLFIENVGNLICPTEFQLGEHERVTVLSVTEGADKPAKYPLAFRTATAVVINKMDLLPYVDFDLKEVRRLIEGLNPKAKVFELSAKTQDGMAPWLDWLKR